MRGFWSSVVLTVAVLLPNVGSAQVFQFRTPPPDISAGAAGWQINGEAVVVGGRVPVYTDTTIEPHSELYVPLGNGRMRVYERRRERELAGSIVPRLGSDSASTVPPAGARPRRVSIITAVPHDPAAEGVWLEFNGSRWYSSGPAVSFSPERFVPTGEYLGFPVYRETLSATDEIWVSVVKNGPLAPFTKQ